ncbi:MAG: Ppx/GppA phosphatase family protein, partial [Allosphingosinicella sp.]
MAQQAATAPLPPAREPAEAAGPPLHERRHYPRPCYGALDLGTNNCRLLIARPAEEGFVVIDAFSRVVRLGEGLATSGRIADDAQDRAVAALGVCAEKLRRRRVTLSRSVATEACRRAVNGRHFVERVKHETGIALEIISPEEEARLAMLGCHRLLEPGDGPALIFDIGGGSTELVLVDQAEGTPRIRAWWSAPWGVVSLTESEGKAAIEGEDRLAAYERMRARARESVSRFAE